jgi:hypothetical protein
VDTEAGLSASPMGNRGRGSELAPIRAFAARSGRRPVGLPPVQRGRARHAAEFRTLGRAQGRSRPGSRIHRLPRDCYGPLNSKNRRLMGRCGYPRRRSGEVATQIADRAEKAAAPGPPSQKAWPSDGP